MSGTPRPKLEHRLEYAGFRAALAATNLLPEKMAESLGARLARLGYRPLGIRADEVERNLKRAFPDTTPEWRREIAAASYAHLGREMVAMMRLSEMPRAELLARTEIIDIERIGPYYRESGRGAVVIGGHFGNWEVGAAMIAARGYPVSMVAQRQSNPLFDRHLVAARERLGIRVIERGQAPRLALRALRNAEVVVFGADQNAGRTGVFVPFFGTPASTHRGPALMAVRTNALVFVATPIRIGNDRWRMGLDEVVVDRTGEVDDVVLRLTRAFTERLEAAIRREPGQYLWQHRRWKTRPPEEPEPRKPV
jgi:KDO2-lipid IV(A) lauroyltransferase